MNKKYVIGIVAVVIVLGLILIFASNQNVQQQQSPAQAPVQVPAQNTQNAQQPSTATGATGNVDDIAATVLSDTNSDEPPAAESDPSLLSENDSAISDYGQSLGSATQ